MTRKITPPRVLTETSMKRAERRFPSLAARAGFTAFQNVLAKTGKVTIVSGGQMLRMTSDGAETVVKTVAPATRIKPGRFKRGS